MKKIISSSFPFNQMPDRQFFLTCRLGGTVLIMYAIHFPFQAFLEDAPAIVHQFATADDMERNSTKNAV